MPALKITGMYKILKAFLFTALMAGGWSNSALASNLDTIPEPVSVDPKLLELATQTVPQEYTIRRITVSGHKTLDAPIIVSISGLSSGDKLMIPGSDNFAKAIQNLWKQNLLSDIAIYYTKVDGSEIDIEIAITERPRLSNYTFKGVKKSEEEDLVAKAGLVKSRVVTENVKKTAVENIRKHYIEKAFLNVEVNLEERPDPSAPNLVFLVFNIKKGKKIKVNEINFYGNEAVNDLKLKKQMKGTKEMARLTLSPTEVKSSFGVNKHQTFKEFIKSKGYFYPSKIRDFLDPYFKFKFFSSAKFDNKKYEEDKEKVLAYYNSQGYRDAVIAGEDTSYDSKGNINLNLKINEGRKYYFGDIVWKGNTKYSDSILNYLLGIRKGDIYNVDVLNKKLGKQLSPEGGDISGLYMDDGYLFFQVDPIETAVYNDTIDFEIRMREGPQATIKNVTIAGNDKTKEYVIRRELRTVPGEKFSRSDLIRSTRELSQLGYFNPEKINPGVVPDYENGTVDINWVVEEKSSDQLELSAGWGGGIGLTGTLGVTFNNFSAKNLFKKSAWDPLPQGDGQKLSLRVQSNGKYFQSYNFSFTEPWLGGKKRNSLTVSGFYTKYSAGVNADGINRYLITRGAVVALGKQLRWPDDYFSLIYSLNFTQYKLRDYPGLIPNLSDGLSTNLSLKIALNRSSIDQPLFPTKGSSFMMSGQFTPPYSLFRDASKDANPYKFVEFHKWRFTGEWYVPIGRATGAEHNKQFVFRAAAKFGFMGRYNNKLEISPFERFQLGNSGLTNNFGVLGYDIIAHRGYPVYENSNPKINPDENVQQASQFFTIFNKYTFELRYPFSLNPSSTIYGLAFFEAANGWYNFKEYNPFRLRRSVGVGMRFYLPMFGLLGFDYGVGLDRLNGTNRLRDASSFTFMLGFEPE